MEPIDLNMECIPDITDSASVFKAASCEGKNTTSKTRQRRSDVWNHFERFLVNGVERASCKYCGASYNGDSKSGTSNPRKHLQKCRKYQDTLNVGGKYQHFDPVVYRDLIARAIVKHGYAFSWVEHEGNRDIHFYLNSEAQTISRNTTKSDCLKLHADLKKRMKDTLCSINGRVSLTSDMWTSCQTKGHMCLTAHYVDDEWKLHNEVLNFRHVPSPHTRVVLYDTLYGMLRDWGIENKVFSITLDNASSNFSLQRRLIEQLNAQGALVGSGKYFHVRCAAHILNLIVQDSLTVIGPCISKVRESVKYVEGSESRIMRSRECVQWANLKHTSSLWLDVPSY